jgi:phosphoribosylanthranilate isomerase
MIIAHNITNLTDARYFAAKGVDYLVFNFEKDLPGFVDPLVVKAMNEWVEGPHLTGAFHQSSVATVTKAIAFHNLKAVEILIPESIEEVNEAFSIHLYVLFIIKMNGQTPEDISKIHKEFYPQTDCMILDFGDQDIRPLFEQEAWVKLIEDTHYIGIRSNAPFAHLKPIMERFIDLSWSISGSSEEKVGVKSFDELDEMFECLDEVKKLAEIKAAKRLKQIKRENNKIHKEEKAKAQREREGIYDDDEA